MADQAAVRTVVVLDASSGIGAACVDALLGRGYRVHACSRTPPATDDGRAGLFRQTLDVCDDASIAAAAGAIASEVGKDAWPIALVNAVGVGLIRPAGQITPAQFEHVFTTNLFGPWGFLRELEALVGPQLRRVIHIGSTSAHIPAALCGGYCASKAALDALVACRRLESGVDGPDQTVLDLGVIATPFWAKLKAQERTLLDQHGVDQPFSRALIEARLATDPGAHGRSPEAVAERIAELLARPRLRRRHVLGFGVRLKLLAHRWLPETVVERARLRRR